MDISQRGVDLIVSFEGKHKLRSDGKYQAYLDTLAKPPVWTIYCGLTKGVGKDMCISAEEGDRMFAKELAVHEDAVERLVTVPLNQNMFDALTSFVYNCGPGALQNSTLLKLLNQGKYEQVPAQLMRWCNAGGKRYEGLARRRAAEGALFMEPMEKAAVATHEEEPVPAMPQRVEEAPAASVKEAVTTSGTIKAAILALPGAVYGVFEQSYDWLFGVAKQAGPEVIALKTTLTPFDALLKMTPTVLAILTIIGLTVVVGRKIADRRAGTSV
jgi:lysozyme